MDKKIKKHLYKICVTFLSYIHTHMTCYFKLFSILTLRKDPSIFLDCLLSPLMVTNTTVEFLFRCKIFTT